MAEPLLIKFLSRQQRVVASALVALVIFSWWYLIALADGMSGMMMGLAPWTALDWFSMIAMWAIMMVGMMIPSAAPMILLFAGLQKKGKLGQASQSVNALVFMAGYIVMWTVFSLAATAVQWGFEQAVLLSPMMVSNSGYLNGAILVCAGVYQWLPIKESCLRHCRSPAQFISDHWRPGARGAFYMGLHHGAYCLGCCWVLMALLFVGGVMNLVWIAFIAAVVLVEKIAPRGDLIGRLGGLLLGVVGVAIISEI